MIKRILLTAHSRKRILSREIDYDKSMNILDIGCGTGRHAIEFAKRGYKVTGIDLSESQLQRAQQKAGMENIKVDFRLADARNLNFKGQFDLIIMLCEGAFPLMETDEMKTKVFSKIKQIRKKACNSISL